MSCPNFQGKNTTTNFFESTIRKSHIDIDIIIYNKVVGNLNVG